MQDAISSEIAMNDLTFLERLRNLIMDFLDLKDIRLCGSKKIHKPINLIISEEIIKRQNNY